MDRLVGRDAPLRDLDAALAAAADGRGSLVFVAGEPGIGKTRVVEELAVHARSSGAEVLWATSWDDAGAPAFWPWIQALRALAQSRPGAAVFEGATSEVARLVPELGPGMSEPTSDEADPDQARFRLFDAVTGVLRRAAAIRPLMLVLEDLHWADESSLSLLRFVARELRSLPLCVVGTYRDVELENAALARVVATSVRIPLGPLTETETAQLVDSLIDGEVDTDVARRVHVRTGGNPLFVRETVRLLQGADGAGGWEGSIPEGVREVIDRRLARLPQRSHEILEAAAVVGPDFDVDVIVAATGTATNDVLDAVDAAIAARLVLLRSLPGRYGFSHALIRETLYTGIGSVRRAEVHERVAAAIESLGVHDLDAHAAELAHHCIHALPSGDRSRAVEYSARAGRRATDQLAFEEAAAHYRRALEVLEAGPADGDRRVELLLALGESELAGGNLARARAVFDEVAELAERRERPDELARAALGFGAGLGGFEVRLFDQHQIDLLEAALHALTAGDSLLRASVMARLSVALSMVESERRRVELSRDAVAMARRAGDPRVLSYALGSLCDAIAGPDYVEERLTITTEMLEAAEAAGDRQCALLARRFRVVARLEHGDLRATDSEIEVFARLASALRQPLSLWYVPLFRGMRALLRGEFSEAERFAREAEVIGERAGSFNAEILVMTLRTGIDVERGDPAAALRRFHQIMADHPEASEYPSTAIGIGWLEALCGNNAAARAALDRIASNLASLPDDAEWLETMGALAELSAIVGEPAYAAELYEQLLPRRGLVAVDGIAAVCYGSLSRYLGLLASLLQRWDAAERHFEDALADHRRIGAPNLGAHTKRNHASMLMERDAPGDRERAMQLLDEAIGTYMELGANGWVGRTRHLLARSPTGPVTSGLARFDDQPESNVFRREGDVWLLKYAGRSARMKDAKGLHDLSSLLGQPGIPLHASELVAATAGTAELYAPGGADEILDSRARATYKARLEELESVLETATQANDTGRADRARAERDFLIEELTKALGLAGRSRRLGDPGERARKAVSMRIRLALDRMQAAHPELERHLRNSVRTGTWCVYEPERQTAWSH